MDHKIHFVIFSNSIMESNTMAGGSRIFLECLRHWLDKGHTADIITSQQGLVMSQRYLSNPRLRYRILGPTGPDSNPAFRSILFSGYLHAARTLNGIYQSLQTSKYKPGTIFYSTTPFWPDIFPALVSFLRNRDTLWLVAFSMFAPPLVGGWQSGMNTNKKGIELRAIALRISELLVYPIVKRWANLIYVNNEMDLKRVRSDGIPPNRSIIIGGGVDVTLSNSVVPKGPPQFDAVFVGRFHPQKGVLELVDIWKRVCNKLPNAKLIMIGNGPLEKSVGQKIVGMHMEQNISLAGFKDGIDKIEIFHQSRVVLHPALYDSGGMAAAEAMICGLPGVSFDLPALRTYYPKGMLKAKDEEQFANHIIRLLSNSILYDEISNEAQKWAESWDWRLVSDQLLQKCQNIIKNNY